MDNLERADSLVKKRTGPKIWCSAVNCSMNKQTHPELSFFRFPSDPTRYSMFSVAKIVSNSAYSYFTRSTKIVPEVPKFPFGP